MYKLLQTTYKEILLLSRDIGGLVILFVMPLLLIITIALIQNGSFKAIDSTKIPILVVDLDQGELSTQILKNFKENSVFEIIHTKDGINLTEEQVQAAVFNGDYQMGIVIPTDMSSDLKKKVSQNVSSILAEFGMGEEERTTNTTAIQPKEIKLYFDPATQKSFKDAVMNSIDKMVSKLENQSIYKAFQKELGEEDKPLFAEESFIQFKEINLHVGDQTIIPNTTQHNVPAWTLFAIFFIVIPLSINIVKEKDQGTSIRLLANPVSYLTLLGGKIVTYLSVCMIQFTLMLLLGIFLFPILGLPMLEFGMSDILPLFAVAFFSGLAAIGFGILLGTLATTQEQAAPFGATSVVILAAIGGIWVPVFLMPQLMQLLSNISPMNWGLMAFYDVLLRQNGWAAIFPELALLLLFFLITISISVYYDKNQKAV